MKRSSLAVPCATLALALAPGMAQAAPTVTVNVGGTNYDVTYFQGLYQNNTSKFQVPPGGQMPWFGSSSLAEAFANAVSNQLGLPVYNSSGPFFADSIDNSYGILTGWRWDTDLNPDGPFKSTYSFSFSAGAFATATLTPTPSAVPGPLPLFGAAAAFGVSRRLRRRCQLGG